jgi:hypothetical protein
MDDLDVVLSDELFGEWRNDEFNGDDYDLETCPVCWAHVSVCQGHTKESWNWD